MEEQTEVTVEEQEQSTVLHPDKVIEELTLEERVNKLQQELNEYQESNEKKDETISTLEATMEKTKLITTLNAEGLDKFQGLFDLTTTEDRVAFLKNAVNQILVENSYQPKQQVKQEQYELAINSGDVNGAIKHKLAKLFGK